MPLYKEQHKKETPDWIHSDFVAVEEKEGKEESNEEEVCENSSKILINQEGESLDDYLTRQTREFNANTRYHPEDIKTWLKFVDFQVS